MKEYVVLLPFDTEAFRNEKIDIIRRLVGEDNVSYYGDINDHTIPNIAIRCNKKTWKKLNSNWAYVKLIGKSKWNWLCELYRAFSFYRLSESRPI